MATNYNEPDDVHVPRIYTEIYARIDAGPLACGASLNRMWKTICTDTMATTVMVLWFAVVILGFGSHVWPLLKGVP